MKIQLKIIGFIILTLLIGCDQQEEELAIDKSNFLEKYEPFNVDSYKALVENEVNAAKGLHESLTNRSILISKSTSVVAKSKKLKLKVPDDYPTIQDAVDAAQDGTEILINGNFIENVSLQNRNNLILKGISGASVDCSLCGVNFSAIEVDESTNIQIKNLRIRGTIGIVDSDDISVKNNEISDGYYGVLMTNSTNCEIKQNYIHDILGNSFGIGGGIYGGNNDNNQIKENVISDARVGIEFLFDSDHNTIKENTISDMSNFGLGLVIDCDNNKVYNTIITNAAWSGFSIVNNSNENDVRGLQTSNCGDGIIIFEPCNNNTIREANTFNNQGVGILLWPEARENLILELHTYNNAYGMVLLPDADSNTIRESTGENNAICDLLDLGNNNSFIESQFNNTCN